MEAGIHAGLTPAEGRGFGLKVGAAFLALAGISYWRGHSIAPMVLGGLGGLLFLGGLVVPGQLGGVYRGWMGLAGLISKVTTPIFLGIVYFLVLTPLGLIRRAFGKRPIDHGLVEGGYWVRRTVTRPPQHMERQF